MNRAELKLAYAANAKGITRAQHVARRVKALVAVTKKERWTDDELALYGKQLQHVVDVVWPPAQSRGTRALQSDANAPTVRRMRVSHGWSWERVYQSKIVTIPNKDGSGGKAMWRELLYMVHISPKGRRYVQALPHEQADLLHVGVTAELGVPPVRLRRFERSLLVKRSAKYVGTVERGQAAHAEKMEARKAKRNASVMEDE